MIDAISNALAEPTLAFALYVLGTLAILYEIFKPGSIFPGVAGGTMVVGAILASRVLPVRPIAVFGIAAGLGLLTTEVYVRSRGILACLGLLVMVVSSLMFLYPDRDFRYSAVPAPSHYWTTLTIAASIALSIGAAVAILVGGRRIIDHESLGSDNSIQLVGLQGTWQGNGVVSIGDDRWRADSPSALAVGARVLVSGAVGFALTVVPLDAAQSPTEFEKPRGA